MPIKKSVRIIKKVRDEDGQWRFISLRHAGTRYVWDKRPGHYFVEWWEGRQRRRESAGITPSEAMEAQRRKRNELIGAFVLGTGTREAPKQGETQFTLITDAVALFLDHVRVHSPDKPRTVRRYSNVLDHVKRILGRKLAGATLHKFRHTYATRLLESGCDIVTVQKLMGHSDLDTTRQYLDPDEKLKRSAVSRLSLATLTGA
jgi:integrase